MNPQNNQSRDMPSASDREHTLNTQRQAAVNVIRGDISRIFNDGGSPTAEAEKSLQQEYSAQIKKSTPQPEVLKTDNATNSSADYSLNKKGEIPEEWQQYHTSWQSYYKQYYERYYLNHIHTQKTKKTSSPSGEIINSAQTDDEAVNELRDKLLKTVQEQASTVRKSRHFAPIATALVVALLFLFLEFNRFIFATVQAYVSPGSANPQAVIVEGVDNNKVGPDPKLIIPKINVEAPVIYNVNPADNTAVENSLRDGVVHYPIVNAASNPGEKGATVILGHSSNDVFDEGKYKFVFVQLNKLNEGDTLYVNNQGVRYTYSVTRKDIIDPKEVNKVSADPSKPSIILITCEPPGTALKRLLVFADQVTPDPEKSTAPKSSQSTQQDTQNTSIIGNSPTFLERIFGQH
jgi:sortase A